MAKGKTKRPRLSDAEKRKLEATVAKLPQWLWCKASGVHRAQLERQAKSYGIPFGGPTVNLFEFLPALHAFFAKFGQRWLRQGGTQSNGDDEVNGWDDSATESPALERYRLARAKKEEILLAQLRESLIPKAEVHERLQQIGRILRSYGTAVQKRFGNDAWELFEQALNECDQHVEQFMAEAKETRGEPLS